jgi:hypothetical protein
MSSALALAVVPVALTGCNDYALTTEAASGEALSERSGAVAAAASMSANRGSWNNWHVHDLPYGAEPYTDAEGLRHEDYNIWPVIWPDYPSDESPVVYCIDGAEKVLVGGDGGSKLAAGTCRNDRYIIQIQLNASDAPAPAERSGWIALPLGNGFILYYRLTAR